MHDMPGTTRDAIDTIVETDDGPLRFVDTAGLRRKSRIDESTEYYGLVRALRGDRPRRRRAVPHRRDRRRHPPGPAPRRARRRGRHRDRARAQQVGAARRRAAGRGAARQVAGQARRSSTYAPVLPISALTGKACAPPAAGAAGGRGGVPPAHPDRGAEPGAARRAGRAPAAGREEAPAADPVRDAGRGRTADVHPVRDPQPPADLPAVPRAQAAGGVRLSVRRRSSCVSAAGPSSDARAAET